MTKTIQTEVFQLNFMKCFYSSKSNHWGGRNLLFNVLHSLRTLWRHTCTKFICHNSVSLQSKQDYVTHLHRTLICRDNKIFSFKIGNCLQLC
jgi:deoxyribodipyrimidine photolyase-like uncharacterized protein